MPKVVHPSFPEIVNEITDDQIEDHLAAGWVLPPVEKPKPSTTK